MCVANKIFCAIFLLLITKSEFSQRLDTIAMYDYDTKLTTFINPVEVCIFYTFVKMNN